MAAVDDPELKRRLAILELHMRDGNAEIHIDGLLVSIEQEGNIIKHGC